MKVFGSTFCGGGCGSMQQLADDGDNLFLPHRKPNGEPCRGEAGSPSLWLVSYEDAKALKQRLAEVERQLAATQFVCDERERELREVKGPCSNRNCRLHHLHAGPCAGFRG